MSQQKLYAALAELCSRAPVVLQRPNWISLPLLHSSEERRFATLRNTTADSTRNVSTPQNLEYISYMMGAFSPRIMKILINSWCRMKQYWRLPLVRSWFLLNLHLTCVASRRCLTNKLYVINKLIIWPCYILGWLFNTVCWAQTEGNPCGICEGQSGNGTICRLLRSSPAKCRSFHHIFIFIHLSSGSYYTRLISNK